MEPLQTRELTKEKRKGTPTMPALGLEPITAKESEQPALKKIDGVLTSPRHVPKLVGPHGEEIELPMSLFQILRQIIYHMTHGRAISIVPFNQELSTQEAADLLNVSRPYLIKLLEQGEIPFTKVGTHRRVRFDELMRYKQKRDTKRKSSLAEIAHMSEDYGVYD
jgi:excisionase family DNA binding protein